MTVVGDPGATAPAISVVIPTYDRLPRLVRVLEALRDQLPVPGGFEVVVVSDGSTDGTDEYLRSGATPLPVTAVAQANGGPATARNRGVEVARAALVLFLDDDVVPDPGLVGAHVARQGDADDLVVIGPLLTPADADLEPWVRWEQAMLDKQYAALASGEWTAAAQHFYTGNASLPRRRLLDAGGFDPAFRRAEDVELGYRLADHGLRFAFAPEAAGHHYAERSFPSWMAIAEAYGRNDAVFIRDQGRGWLLAARREELQQRHVLTRAVARACVGRPRLRASAAAVLRPAARAAGALALRPVAQAALSGLFNLAYFDGLAQELGGRHALLGPTGGRRRRAGVP